MGVADIFESAIDDWRRERPDLALDAMAPVTRILAAATVTRRIGEEIASRAGLTFGEYEVLAVLRRSRDGEPLKPGQITRSILISPGGLTSRLDRLESARLVTRRRDPADGRSSLVALTAKGRRKVDAIFSEVTASGNATFAVLSAAEVATLVDVLDRLIDRAIIDLAPA